MSREATAANSRERQLTGHDLNELVEPRSGGSNDEGPQLEFCQLWSAGIHHRFHFSISPRLFEGSSTNPVLQNQDEARKKSGNQFPQSK